MKKHWLRNSLSLLLVGVMLLSALPVGATGAGTDDETTQFPAGEQPPITVDPSDDETPVVPIIPTVSGTAATVLYSWTASALNRDLNAFSSNLSDESDLNQRWNETAQLYTGQESKTVSIHSFLNEAKTDYGLKTVKDFAGRTAVENLQVDVYPMAQISSDLKAVGLSFVYAYKPEENGVNPANSGLLQVYVSADGVNWSEDFVTVRSAHIVGSGIGQNGEDVIYYNVFTEDLTDIAEGDISVLRIMPDGSSGMCGGSFSLCELTLSGYKTKADFNKAVPAEAEGTPADRAAVLAAYQGATGSDGLDRAKAAMALVSRTEVDSIPAMLDALGVRFADGVALKATADVRQIFEWMAAKKLRTWANMQPILDEYEHITSTEKVIKDLNRPQQIFKAYAKCDVGDLLVQVKKDGTSDVYMVAQKVSAQSDKAGNINIAESTITYTDSTGVTHKDAKIFDLYKQGFVPMVMDALADDAVQPVRVDAYVSVADQVRLAVSSNFDIEKIELSGDFEDTVTRPGAATVYTNASLNELPEGKYTMTAKVYTAANGTPIDVPVSFEIEGAPMQVLANVDMVNALDMNFYVAQSNFEGNGYYAKLAGPNGTKTVPMADWKTNGSYYQFTYDGLAAKQMSAEITVTVYDADGNRVSRPWVDSIRTYVMRMFDREDVTDKARVLYADMLNYGAAAQKYFNYQTDDLANSLLSDAQKAYATTTVAACSDQRVKGDNYYGTNFDLTSRISMNLYFTNVTDDMTATITFENHRGEQPEMVEVPGTDFIDNGSCKVVNVSEIVAADGRQLVTCTIRNGNNEEVASVTDSLESYVARMSGSYPWLLEIMKFSDSARDYLHSQNQNAQ